MLPDHHDDAIDQNGCHQGVHPSGATQMQRELRPSIRIWMPLLGSMCRNTFYPLELASVSFKQRGLQKSDISEETPGVLLGDGNWGVSLQVSVKHL